MMPAVVKDQKQISRFDRPTDLTGIANFKVRERKEVIHCYPNF